MSSHLPWIEKHRPKTLNDVVGHRDAIDRLRVIAQHGNIPNLLLTGTGVPFSVLTDTTPAPSGGLFSVLKTVADHRRSQGLPPVHEWTNTAWEAVYPALYAMLLSRGHVVTERVFMDPSVSLVSRALMTRQVQQMRGIVVDTAQEAGVVVRVAPSDAALPRRVSLPSPSLSVDVPLDQLGVRIPRDSDTSLGPMLAEDAMASETHTDQTQEGVAVHIRRTPASVYASVPRQDLLDYRMERLSLSYDAALLPDHPPLRGDCAHFGGLDSVSLPSSLAGERYSSGDEVIEVPPEWIDDSHAANEWVDPADYIPVRQEELGAAPPPPLPLMTVSLRLPADPTKPGATPKVTSKKGKKGQRKRASKAAGGEDQLTLGLDRVRLMKELVDLAPSGSVQSVHAHRQLRMDIDSATNEEAADERAEEYDALCTRIPNPELRVEEGGGGASGERPPETDPLYNNVFVPVFGAFFDPKGIAQEEREALPMFFDGTFPSYTPERYMEWRNAIVSAYRTDPSTNLTFTAVRRTLSGEACSMMRIYRFLERKGLINYRPSPQDIRKLKDCLSMPLEPIADNVRSYNPFPSSDVGGDTHAPQPVQAVRTMPPSVQPSATAVNLALSLSLPTGDTERTAALAPLPGLAAHLAAEQTRQAEGEVERERLLGLVRGEGHSLPLTSWSALLKAERERAGEGMEVNSTPSTPSVSDLVRAVLRLDQSDLSRTPDTPLSSLPPPSDPLSASTFDLLSSLPSYSHSALSAICHSASRAAVDAAYSALLASPDVTPSHVLQACDGHDTVSDAQQAQAPASLLSLSQAEVQAMLERGTLRRGDYLVWKKEREKQAMDAEEASLLERLMQVEAGISRLSAE
ncbi:hypothetical protein KIPB_001690 [Kipferlia bialata]|uniref:SWIRM domain-containing protein n=1 Tax=Kipferlia bialata TaxID=797122 RepID=A0A9K3CR50_9EUKA|nr:hypothetical protein KIPB_001690 [Kipferlia bialata]|eukprot:g1690.t1